MEDHTAPTADPAAPAGTPETPVLTAADVAAQNAGRKFILGSGYKSWDRAKMSRNGRVRVEADRTNEDGQVYAHFVYVDADVRARYVD